MTCKSFYLNSMKLLYERLILINPLHFVSCLDLLSCKETFTTPKHATIGFSPFPHLLIPVDVTTLEGNTTIQHYSPNSESILDVPQPNPQPSFISDPLYSSLISTCVRFSHLESLAFVHTYIPPTTLSTLSTLNLKSLVLYRCYCPNSGDDPIPQLAELRTLSLRELSFRDKPDFDGLLFSPRLLELSIDDTSAELIVVGKRMVGNLRRLQVFRARTTWAEADDMHPDDVQEVVSWIVSNNPLIEDILSEFGLGPRPCGTDGPDFLENSLKYYVGPSSAFSLFDRGYKNLAVLELTDDNSVANHVKSIVSTLPNLYCLSLVADGDFIRNLSGMPLRHLDKLNLVYAGSIPAVRINDLAMIRKLIVPSSRTNYGIV
jgi:hypothetical protein